MLHTCCTICVLHVDIFQSQSRTQLHKSSIQHPTTGTKVPTENDKYCLFIKTLHIKSNVMFNNDSEK
jgi:hypothetical protein